MTYHGMQMQPLAKGTPMPILENETMQKILFLLFVCVIALILQTVVGRVARRVLEKGHVPKGSILVNLITAFIWFDALLAVLEPVFGVQPTAFVAALGVVSIAVSFGLQTTISNVIAGLGLMLARVIEVGDWIEVDGFQGVVTDITWRATTIRTLIGDIIVIPNSVLNSTTLRKLSDLSARSIVISLDIFPEADLVEVERDIRASVEEAAAEYIDPELGVLLIEMGYGSFGFRLDVRVGLKDLDHLLEARSAVVGACAGRSYLARW